jgi:hypothetical protein
MPIDGIMLQSTAGRVSKDLVLQTDVLDAYDCI